MVTTWMHICMQSLQGIDGLSAIWAGTSPSQRLLRSASTTMSRPDGSARPQTAAHENRINGMYLHSSVRSVLFFCESQ